MVPTVDEPDWEDKTSVGKPEEIRPTTPASRDRAFLIVLAGSNVGEMYKIERSETTLGRGAKADIRLVDEGISRIHARIRTKGDQLFVEDMESRNGTYCNGEQIAGVELGDGDKIQLGRTTVLKFTYHDDLDETFQRQMFDSALRDALTKIYNKRYLMGRLQGEIRFALRHQTPLSLLLFDLDHFKKVNDTYGHLAGDQVLVSFADKVNKAIRNEDVFARYGGEEFVIITRGIARPDAMRFADRIRHEVENLHIEHDGTHIPITVSIGLATIPEDQASTPQELIGVADLALYEAKNSGRNKVCASQSFEEKTDPEA